MNPEIIKSTQEGVCTLHMKPTAILYKGLKLLQILAPGGFGKVGVSLEPITLLDQGMAVMFSKCL